MEIRTNRPPVPAIDHSDPFGDFYMTQMSKPMQFCPVSTQKLGEKWNFQGNTYDGGNGRKWSKRAILGLHNFYNLSYIPTKLGMYIVGLLGYCAHPISQSPLHV